jgi:Zinc knuckle
MRQECPALKAKEPDKKTGFDRRNVSLGVKKCFNCREFGHMAKDNKCPPDKKGKGTSAQMYTVREVIQEDDEDDKPSEDKEEEDSEPYKGSQYSSEGEEFKFEFDDIGLQEEDDSNDRRGVHMYAL